jgi:hypothetical protein
MKFGRKGQASTEYLVILAVVIIIALVVVAVLGGFIDIGTGATQQSAKAYWRTADIGIVDWSQNTTTFTAVVRNNQDYKVSLTKMNVSGTADTTAVTLTPGATASKNIAIACTAGSSYSYTVAFTYDNLDYSITGKTFTGTQKVVGKC